jgi:nucleoid DNA-binding protein
MEKVYKEVAKELEISEHIVETVLRHKFSWLRKQLTQMNNVAILDNNFGTFYIPKSKVKKYLTYVNSALSKTNEQEKLLKEKHKYDIILEAVEKYNNSKKIEKEIIINNPLKDAKIKFVDNEDNEENEIEQ